MWMFDEYGVDYEVVGADDYARLGRFDTIVMAPGISAERLTQGLDPARYPERFHWARGVPDALARLRAWTERGGNLVAIGSSSLTAAGALELPLENVAVNDDLEVPGALLHQQFRRAVPGAWGMPARWPVWFNNDPAFRLNGRGQVASSYPQGEELLVSGYAAGVDSLAARRTS